MRTAQRGIVLAYLLTAACGGNSTSERDNFKGDATGGDGGATNGQANGETTSSAGTNGTADNTCEEHVVRSERAAPDMLIVLDRSGSMNPEGNDDDSDRWGGSRDAVVSVTDMFDDRVRFGLMTFPEFTGNGGGGRPNMATQCAPGTVNVQIGSDQGPAIASALADMNANGRTPTAPSLEAALSVIGDAQAAGPDEAQHAKYVLLVTDGDPNCSGQDTGGMGEPDPLARQQTIDAISALTAAGVQTFVVGYQTAGSDFAAQLDLMAAAGGTGETMHRSVESGDDLAQTFSDIAGGVVSCSFKLDDAVKDPSYVLVSVDGVPRSLNQAADGWTLAADMQTVTLTGAACDAVKAGGTFAVEVQCEVVQIQ